MSNSTTLRSPAFPWAVSKPAKPSTDDLRIGDIVETMLVGKIVKAKITAIASNETGREFTVEYIGERICLDFGANWYVDAGYEFTTRPTNIARATEWRAKGY